MQLLARDTSAKFANEHMQEATRYKDRDTLLKDAVKRASQLAGCICEFGVYSGRSLKLVAVSAPSKEIHGFDSFEGLPLDWRPGFKKGAFKTTMPKLRQPNVRLHVGWFDATLPPFLAQLREPISLVHIDCDLYSSTKCVLEGITPYLAPEAILVFDEYFNYPGWERHEYKTLEETVRSGFFNIEYLGYNVCGQQVMLRAIKHEHSAL